MQIKTYLFRLEPCSLILVHDGVLHIEVLEPSDRSLKVPWIRESIGSDRSEIGQLEVGTVHLEDVAAGGTTDGDGESDSLRDHDDLLRLDEKTSELCGDFKGALLRNWKDKMIDKLTDKRDNSPMRKSPSELYIAVCSMLALHEN